MDVASVTSYHFDAPPPFGHGGGSTAFKMSNQIYLGELQAIAVAGLEAESILSRNLKARFIKQRKINPKLGSLYTASRYSSLIYSFVPFFEEKIYRRYFSWISRHTKLCELSWISLSRVCCLT